MVDLMDSQTAAIVTQYNLAANVRDRYDLSMHDAVGIAMMVIAHEQTKALDRITTCLERVDRNLERIADGGSI